MRLKNRDLRLKQTIRLGDYKRISAGVLIPGPPLFSYTFTGYMPIKWALDDMYYDTRDLNINSISMFRYGEVLLNFAEAKAELGTLTDAEWAATIGVLRTRGGITAGLNTKPTVVDTYLQSVLFPEYNRSGYPGGKKRERDRTVSGGFPFPRYPKMEKRRTYEPGMERFLCSCTFNTNGSQRRWCQ